MTGKQKLHDKKRAELLDAAWALFGECGYEKATVSAIIDRIGVAKGTFYHYFSSKQEVLDAAIEREVDRCRQEIESTINVTSMSALERLNQFFTLIWEYKQSHIREAEWLAPILLGDSDIVVRHKFDARTAEMSADLMSGIVSQGVEEGVFNTPSPEAASLLIVRFWDSLKGAGTTALPELQGLTDVASHIESVLDFYIDAVERLLGTEKGAITRPSRSYIETFAGIHTNLKAISREQ